MESSAAGKPGLANTTLRLAVRALSTVPGPTPVHARVLASLAHSESELGRVHRGLDLLSEATRLAGELDNPELQGVLHSQRALLALRHGELTVALRDFDIAVTLIPDTSMDLVVALLNRSAVHLYLGSPAHAAADLRRGEELIPASDRLLRAKFLHNIGYVTFLRGEVPGALMYLAQAESSAPDSAAGYRGVIHLDRGRMLSEAGLLAEAEAELAVASAAFHEFGLDQDLAEAELVRAEIALLDDRPDEVTVHIREARRRFRRRHNVTGVLLAEAVQLQSTLRSAAGTRLVADPRATAEALRLAGLVEDARALSLLAVRSDIARGSPVAPPHVRRGDRIGNRLLTRLVLAEIAQANGGPRKARLELRRGIHELHRHRARFGSLDMSSAVALHGRDLVQLGLRLAVADGRPSVIHNWIERTRAVSLHLAPVRPPADPQAAEELAELRAVRAALRAAELGAPSDPGLTARQAQLERAIRQRSWLAAGGAGLDDRQARLGEVRASLGEGCLVSYLAVDGIVHAVVVTGRAARVVRLVALDELRADLSRLRSDLDAAALGQVPPPLRRSVLASLASGLQRLHDRLWSPLARWTGDGPVVVVPTGPLAAVPWTMLPGLPGRPLTLAPSATWWLAHRRPLAPVGRVVVAAGPGLLRAEDEVNAVAKVWPGSTMLTGPDATAAGVLDASVDAGVLHLAAHGRHEPDNPLFSAIELADGPLFGYDLPHAAALPPHAVLSACDLGLVVERPGDESLGMTSALLHSGVSSVVAGVARVNDDVACRLMIGYHAALRAGRGPSVALADALAATGSDKPDQPAPFVVIGAGW